MSETFSDLEGDKLDIQTLVNGTHINNTKFSYKWIENRSIFVISINESDSEKYLY